jgi:VTC domain
MRRSPVPDLTGLESLGLISLPEVLAAAPATTRVDRKYLVPLERGEEFLAQLPTSLRLLSVDNRLTTSYRSTYFDTADLLTCRAHIQGRRRRWKARSRLYVEDGLCRLEVKVRDGSGLTRKFFHPTTPDTYGQMDGVAAVCFQNELRIHGVTEAVVLEPAVEVSYERATLADPDTGTRVTIDLGIRATRHQQSVEVDPGYLIVETKGGRVPGVADQLLKQLGARPVSFSKYAASASLMDPRIADNDVRHMLGRQLQLTTVSDDAAARHRTGRPSQPFAPHRPHENLRRTA